MMVKTVRLTLFNVDGSVFHSYNAEIVSETSDRIVVKVPYHGEDYYLETYSKKNGQCLDDCLLLNPQYVMMNAEEPLKNSFVHLPASWWQS